MDDNMKFMGLPVAIGMIIGIVVGAVIGGSYAIGVGIAISAVMCGQLSSIRRWATCRHAR